MGYALPVDNKITQYFGDGKELVWQLGHGHLGVDFGTPHNTPVRAISGGRVLWSNWGNAGLQFRTWAGRWYLVPDNAGIVVVIDHGSHIAVYGHLNGTDLIDGQDVVKGQIIGISGSTGLSTGPHLHLELVKVGTDYNDGRYGRVDPMPLFGADVAPTAPAATGDKLVGIDIATYQAGINVGATGAAFAIVKASEGVGYTEGHYHANVASARLSGARVGHYHMARPGPFNHAEDEFNSFLNIISGTFQKGDQIALDWELDDINNTAWAKRWLDLAQAKFGFKPLIYMNLSTATSLDWSAVQNAGYPLWLAQYPSGTQNVSWAPLAAQPMPAGWTVAIWQHSDRGRVPGYGGNIDVNVFNGDLAAWDALAAGNGFVPTGGTAPMAVPTVTTPSDWVLVDEGDTFSGIAIQFAVDLQAFKNANPGIDYNLIYPGQSLRLPQGSSAPRPAEAIATGVTQCIVSSGDTLSGISNQFGVDLNALIAANPGIDPNLIYPGQVLNLPKKAADLQCIVDPGDTLGSIATQFGVSVDQILRLNPWIANPNVIQPGWVLNLR